jgi:hypothetical protein
MQVIVAGFLDHYAFLCLVQDGLAPDFDLSPGHFIIGAGAALDTAARQIMWMKRQQTEKMSWQRTVFHVHESVRIARSMTEDVGPPADYVVVQPSRIFEILPDAEPLARWSERFTSDDENREDSSGDSCLRAKRSQEFKVAHYRCSLECDTWHNLR